MKKLPIVDIFNPPLEIWSERNMSLEEMTLFFQEHGLAKTTIKDKLIANIDTSWKAAEYIAKEGADNKVEIFVDNVLSKNKNYKIMKQLMPSITPKVLFDYQERYPNFDALQLNNEINTINAVLSEGQTLFHGGKWSDDTQNKLVLSKPFSTTFSPLVALNEAFHKGKAYDANGIDLFVVRAKNPQTPVFVYENEGTFLGHEKEVLFSSGAVLQLKSKKVINQNFKVTKNVDGFNEKEKYVPLRILEVDIN